MMLLLVFDQRLGRLGPFVLVLLFADDKSYCRETGGGGQR